MVCFNLCGNRASSTSPDRVALKVPITSRRLWISCKDVDNVKVVCFGVTVRMIKGYIAAQCILKWFPFLQNGYVYNCLYIFKLVWVELWLLPVPEKSKTCSPACKSSFLVGIEPACSAGLVWNLYALCIWNLPGIPVPWSTFMISIEQWQHTSRHQSFCIETLSTVVYDQSISWRKNTKTII